MSCHTELNTTIKERGQLVYDSFCYNPKKKNILYTYYVLFYLFVSYIF